MSDTLHIPDEITGPSIQMAFLYEAYIRSLKCPPRAPADKIQKYPLLEGLRYFAELSYFLNNLYECVKDNETPQYLRFYLLNVSEVVGIRIGYLYATQGYLPKRSEYLPFMAECLIKATLPTNERYHEKMQAIAEWLGNKGMPRGHATDSYVVVGEFDPNI